MAKFRGEREAFGRPGIEPRWTHGNKDGVGVAYATCARIWFTIFNGVLTEVYYPTVDRAQLRDFQFLVTDGESFFHEEKRHLHRKVGRLAQNALGYRITNSDPLGRYSIAKAVITDPRLPCVLQRTHLSGGEQALSSSWFYVLCAPHLEVGGWGNNAYVVEAAGRWILAAEKSGTWMAMAATVPFSRLYCGYVSHSDGWTDLADNFKMDWDFDRALDGNVALTGELALDGQRDFTLGLAFGDGLHNAVTTLLQALGISFEEQRRNYTLQWDLACHRKLPLEKASGDGGNLYCASYSLLLAHEDKSYPGALIASLTGLLPEQVWDEPDRPEVHMYLGQPTGSAMPLMWAHAEYIKLLRSATDGRVFDFIPDVASRYLGVRNSIKLLEVWKPNRQVHTVRKGCILRVQAPANFRLRWSQDNWQTVNDLPACSTSLGISFVDITIPLAQQAPIRFTFFWTDGGRWEGQDYEVGIQP